jgi:uncharacterized protein YbjT (DUF2867 family)
MANTRKTVIVTGASQGIGAAVASLFLERGYNVVANSRHISNKNELKRSDFLALVDADISLPATAEQLASTALNRFGSIDALRPRRSRHTPARGHPEGVSAVTVALCADRPYQGHRRGGAVPH